MAFALEADIPALLRLGALVALGGQFDSHRDAASLRKRGVDIPLELNGVGHYVLSAASLGKSGGSW